MNTALLSKAQASDVDAIKSYHAASLKGAEDQILYSFLCGKRLESFRQSLPLRAANKEEGFTELAKIHFPEIPAESGRRHRLTFQALNPLIPTVGFKDDPKLLSDGQLPAKDKAAFFKAVHDEFDGKTITDIWRALGIVRKARPPGSKPGTRKPNLTIEDDANPLSDLRQEILLVINEESRALEETSTSDLAAFLIHYLTPLNDRVNAILKRRKLKGL